MKYVKHVATFLGLFLSASAFATPAQIVIIRHGEKPATGDELDQQGCERAYSLPGFFLENAVVNQFGRPVAIFGAQPDHAGSSLRPVQTIAPTAQALGLQIQDPATRLDYSTVVQAIMNNPDYDGRTVLISWEHDAIPGLAQALGATLTQDEQTWPDVVFDEAWVLDYSSAGGGKKHKKAAASSAAGVTLTIIPEHVLPGDNPQGGAAWGNPPGKMRPVSAELANECATDDGLNSLLSSLASPPVQ